MTPRAPWHVAMHAHSDWSYDGRWTLHALARLGGWLGLDAILMSEHDDTFDSERFKAYRRACAVASTGRCTLVPGIEYSSPDNDIHILTWGLDEFLGDHRPVEEILQGVAAQDGVAVFAHPRRRNAWQRYDPQWTPLLHGMELWNRKSDGLCPSDEAMALVRQTGLPATVGVDFHRLNQLYPLSVRFPRISGDIESDAVAAIRAGQLDLLAFRRSLGPSRKPFGPGTVAGHRRLESLRLILKRAIPMRRRKSAAKD